MTERQGYFGTQILGFIADRYGELEPKHYKVAAYRNLGWDVNLSEEHEAAKTFANEEDLTELASYEDAPAEQTEHDAAIQARIHAYREGFRVGYLALQPGIMGLYHSLKTLNPPVNPELIAPLRDQMSQLISDQVSKLGEAEGIPPFMVKSLQEHMIDVSNQLYDAIFMPKAETTDD